MEKETLRQIDLTGLRCLLVTATLAETLAQMANGEVVEAISDDPVAHILVKRWCQDTGNELVLAERLEKGWRFHVRKGTNP